MEQLKHQLNQLLYQSSLQVNNVSEMAYNNQLILQNQAIKASNNKMSAQYQQEDQCKVMIRINSDYINQQQEEVQTPSMTSSYNLQDLQSARLRYLMKLQSAISFCEKDLYENALIELKESEDQAKVLERLSYTYKTVLYYNQACCYHRLGLIPTSIDFMKQAIQSLQDEVQKNDSAESKDELMSHSYLKSLIICDKLHKQRVLCKLTLQLCAIASQSNFHDYALDLASEADIYSRLVIEFTHTLCLEYLQSVVFREQQQQQQQLRQCTESNPYTNPHDSETEVGQQQLDNDYTPTYTSQQKRALDLLHLNRSCNSANQKGQVNMMYGAEGNKRYNDSSFVSSSQRSNNFSNSSITNLKIKQRSLSKNGKNNNKANQQVNEDQSLERVHTFHLKKSPSKEYLPKIFMNDDLPLKKNQIENFQFPCEDKLRFAVENFSSLKPDLTKFTKLPEFLDHPPTIKTQTQPNQSFSKQQLSSLDRAYYIQENTRAHDDIVIRNTQPIIFELKRLLQESGNYRQVNSALKKEFLNESEFEGLKVSQKFKLFCIRSVLGLPKTSISAAGKQPPLQIHTLNKKDEQWIYHLNIGNVMYMQPFDEEDLFRLEGTKSLDLSSTEVIQGVTGGTTSINCSPDRLKRFQFSDTTTRGGRDTPSLEDLQIKVKHELSKDEMLEKVVLQVVSMFCIGTELRFKASSQQQSNQSEIKECSERMHANAIHLASIFLPDECPLVSHMINSYKKHHSKNKAQVIPKSADQGKKFMEIQANIKFDNFPDTGASTNRETNIVQNKQKLVAELLKDCLSQSKQSPKNDTIKTKHYKINDKIWETSRIKQQNVFKSSNQEVKCQNLSPILKSSVPSTSISLPFQLKLSPQPAHQSRNPPKTLPSSSLLTPQPQPLSTNKHQQQHHHHQHQQLYSKPPPSMTILQFSSAQGRSPRQQTALTSPQQLYKSRLNNKMAGVVEKESKKVVAKLENSRISDAGDDQTQVNEMKADRRAVQRQFGMVKKPMDQYIRKGSNKKDVQVLLTSPSQHQSALAISEEEEDRALTERATMKLDDLLSKFDRLQYKTLTDH